MKDGGTDLTKCPTCGANDSLYVRAGTFFAAGMPLYDDGSYNPNDANEWDTCNEVLECDACGNVFLLDDLVREENPDPLGDCLKCGDDNEALAVSYHPEGMMFTLTSPKGTVTKVLTESDLNRLLVYLLRAI